MRPLLRSGKAGDLELAQIEVDSAVEGLLGPLARLIPTLEARSACELLHDPERILGYARLLALRGALRRARGENDAAARDDARGLEFHDFAVAARPDLANYWGDEGPQTS